MGWKEKEERRERERERGEEGEGEGWDGIGEEGGRKRDRKYYASPAHPSEFI